MLNAGQPGFVNAPVTKAAVVCVLLVTLFASIAGAHGALRLAGAAAARQPHRLLTHHLLFSSPGELLFGVTLLYFFRQAERHAGSSRTAAFLAAAAALHTALSLLLAAALPPRLAPAPGPYGLLLPLFVRFFLETPAIYTFSVFHAIPLSDKSFPYLLLLQLLLSNFPPSLPSALSGTITGLALRLPPLSTLDTPAPLSRFAASYLLPWMDTAPRPRRSRRRAPPAAPPRDHVNETQVAALTAMGFSREQAVAALTSSGGDVQAATDRLLR